jgi:uncharacterized Ntn-hydrolase superfamily protein
MERTVSRFIALISLLFLLPSSAFATWSIVAVDRNTGRIAIASATCLGLEEPRSLKGLQAVIVPGVGIAACQALIDGTGANQSVVFEELKKGTDPKEIIRRLHADPGVEQRQYGIVDLRGRIAGFSGASNLKSSLDRQGEVPGTGIFYSIQGNILRGDNVVTEAVKAFVETKGALTDRVMAALEAGDRLGGDSRCSCESAPRASAPCSGKTSHVAYILMAEKTDTNGASYNNGKYAMYLSVTQGTIRAEENANPVKTLRLRYDTWRKAQPASFR